MTHETGRGGEERWDDVFFPAFFEFSSTSVEEHDPLSEGTAWGWL